MCLRENYIWHEKGLGHERIPVPCRDCWQCRNDRTNDYVGRCLAEASVSDNTTVLTLTYAPRDDLADKIITPEHFQKFIRALRKRGHKTRYIAVAEYGKRYGRAHFHCILFNKTPRLDIPHKKNYWIDEWPHGHVYADHGTDEKAIRYACKYMRKGDKQQYWFSLSKKPTIGWEFFEMKARQANHYDVLPSTFTYMPPGGQSSRAYHMTGATRREYLRLLIESEVPYLDKTLSKKNNEWVTKSINKMIRHTVYNKEKEENMTTKKFLKKLKKELKEKRPTKKQAKRILTAIDIATNPKSDYFTYTGLE